MRVYSADISFEMPPGCSSDLRPGRTVEEAQVIASQLERIFGRGVCPVLDMKALCVVDKQHCWKIQVETGGETREDWEDNAQKA